MRLKSSCPHCTARIRIKEDHVAKRIRCPKCKQPFEVKSAEIDTLGSESETWAASETIVAEAESGKLCETTRESSPRLLGKLGRFQLRQVLGQGAFGRVYRAYDPQLDREVALKVPVFGSEDITRVRRFLTEAKAAAKLRHPNIVPVYETGEADGRFFIAAQFVSGQTLAKRIEAGPIELRDAAEWVRALANAIAYAHGEGIVHRDIKPENIMLDEKKQPQIMDFGLAKRTNDDASMTVDGSILGTPAYMSPEQARGEQANVGPASDQYSLGAVLYELLTGQRAFDGATHVVIGKVLSEEPRRPRVVRPEIPHDLEAICSKAMHKERTRRYPSAAEFADDLASWLADRTIQARSITLRERVARWARREPRVASLTLMVALVLLLGIGVSTTFWLRAQGYARELATSLRVAEDATQRAPAEANRASRAEEEAKSRASEADDARRSATDALALAQRRAEELQQALQGKIRAETLAREKEKTAEVATEASRRDATDRQTAENNLILSNAEIALSLNKFQDAEALLNSMHEEVRAERWYSLYEEVRKNTFLRFDLGADNHLKSVDPKAIKLYPAANGTAIAVDSRSGVLFVDLVLAKPTTWLPRRRNVAYQTIFCGLDSHQPKLLFLSPDRWQTVHVSTFETEEYKYSFNHTNHRGKDFSSFAEAEHIITHSIGVYGRVYPAPIRNCKDFCSTSPRNRI